MQAIAKRIYRKTRNTVGELALAALNTPFVEQRLKQRYDEAVSRHSTAQPALSGLDASIVDGLETSGFVVSSLRDLGVPNSSAMLEAATTVAENHRRGLKPGYQRLGTSVHRARAGEIAAFPEIFLWGLSQRLLAIAKAYLGLPVAYDGMNIYHTTASHVPFTPPKWHRDREDRRVLKIAVYCNDVTETGGPLQVIPKTIMSPDTEDFSYPVLSDEALRQRMGASSRSDFQRLIKSFLGPRGTVIFCETGLQYHRGNTPDVDDRTAIYFHYFARVPRHPFLCERSGLSRKQIADVVSGMSKEKIDCALWQQNLPKVARIIPPNML